MTKTKTFRKTLKDQSYRLMTFEAFNQSDEDTLTDQRPNPIQPQIQRP